MKRIWVQVSRDLEWRTEWFWSVEDASDIDNGEPITLADGYAPTEQSAKDAALDWFLEHCPDADVMDYDRYELASAE